MAILNYTEGTLQMNSIQRALANVEKYLLQLSLQTGNSKHPMRMNEPCIVKQFSIILR